MRLFPQATASRIVQPGLCRNIQVSPAQDTRSLCISLTEALP